MMVINKTGVFYRGRKADHYRPDWDQPNCSKENDLSHNPECLRLWGVRSQTSANGTETWSRGKTIYYFLQVLKGI